MNRDDYYDSNNTEVITRTPQDEEVKASETEWWLVIGAVAMVELVQLGMNLFPPLGMILSKMVSIFLGLSVAWWLHSRGGGLKNWKKYVSIMGTFLVEVAPVPFLDVGFFWTTELVLQKYVWNRGVVR